MSFAAGIVRRAAPLVRGINRMNPQAGMVAYNAVARTAKGTQGLASGVGKFKGVFGAAPVIGAATTAAFAANDYYNGVKSGEDPGRVAFRGIGSTLGGVLGGVSGTAVAGPIGGVAGSVAAYTIGDKAFGAGYDQISGMLGGGQDNQPVSYSMSPEEQMAYRRQMRSRQRMAQDNRTDIAGFRYSPNADTGLVAARMQQQNANIATVQQASLAKHLSNNSLKATVGQQSVDRYGIGQDYTTRRYIALKQAEVENNRTNSTTTLGLGQQSVDKFLGGKSLDNERALGMRGYDIENKRLYLDYGDRREERNTKERMYGVDADVRRRVSDNSMAVGAIAGLSSLYRQ